MSFKYLLVCFFLLQLASVILCKNATTLPSNAGTIWTKGSTFTVQDTRSISINGVVIVDIVSDKYNTASKPNFRFVCTNGTCTLSENSGPPVDTDQYKVDYFPKTITSEVTLEFTYKTISINGDNLTFTDNTNNPTKTIIYNFTTSYCSIPSLPDIHKLIVGNGQYTNGSTADVTCSDSALYLDGVEVGQFSMQCQYDTTWDKINEYNRLQCWYAPSLNLTLSSSTILSGKTYTATCAVTEAYPTAVDVSVVSDNGKMQLKKMESNWEFSPTEDDDGAVISCIANNSYAFVNDSKTIDVLFGPVVIPGADYAMSNPQIPIPNQPLVISYQFQSNPKTSVDNTALVKDGDNSTNASYSIVDKTGNIQEFVWTIDQYQLSYDGNYTFEAWSPNATVKENFANLSATFSIPADEPPTTTLAPTTENTSDQGPTKPLSQTIIIAVSCAGGFILILTVILVVLLCRRQSKAGKGNDDADTFEEREERTNELYAPYGNDNGFIREEKANAIYVSSDNADLNNAQASDMYAQVQPKKKVDSKPVVTDVYATVDTKNKKPKPDDASPPESGEVNGGYSGEVTYAVVNKKK